MLGNRRGSDNYEMNRFKEEAQNQGIEFDIVYSDQLDLIVSRDDRKSIRFCDNIVPLPDVLLARTGSGTGHFNLSVLRQFERLNVPTIPNSDSIIASKDKMYANQILAQAGLPIPKTMLTRFPCNTDLVQKQVGFPCVIKVVTGSHGAGVYLCEDAKRFDDLQELISSLDYKNSMIVQEYIEFSEGRDLRVIVVGGRVVGAMQRTSVDGSFKANISRGGVGSQFEMNEELEMLSIQVAKTLDLDIAGVDLLFHNDGYKICEANSAPGFQGFEAAVGVNIPSKIFSYAKLRAS
jgi:gamma-F420-2:alpha-L-glutamate ligase